MVQLAIYVAAVLFLAWVGLFAFALVGAIFLRGVELLQAGIKAAAAMPARVVRKLLAAKPQ